MKRKAEAALLHREGFLKEVKLSTTTAANHLLFFQRPATKLLIPFVQLLHEDFRTIFAYRSYRTLSTTHITDIPVYDESTILDYMEELLERYKSEATEPSPNLIPPVRRTPKKEQRFQLAAEYLVGYNYTLTQVAMLCNLKKTQIQSLERRLKRNGNIMPLKIRRKKILTWEHMQFIRNLIDHSKPGEMTLEKIKTELQQNYDELASICLSTIAQALHSERYSYKRVTQYAENRNFPTTKSQRIDVCLKLVASLYLNYTVIFVDETSIYLGIGSDYGWGLKGQKLQQKNQAKRESFSVLTAITDRKVLGSMILQGGMTQDDYCGFLCTLILSLEELKYATSIVIFGDNLKAHKTELIYTTLGERMTLLFNASYSPMLNPIETFFSKFKKLIKSHTCNTEKQILTAVQESMEGFTTQNFNGYMRNLLLYIYKSLDEQNL